MTDDLLRFGFSTCPNDTHAFFGVAKDAVDRPAPLRDVRLETVLGDIEELNERALSDDPLEITKVSAGILSEVVDRYEILPAGAALGHGVGPLIVVRADSGCHELGDLESRRLAIPGERTTAWALARRFGPRVEPVVMRFDEVLSAVADGKVDAGLIIHESRFTYRDHGLRQLADLGQLWEETTASPLPLAVIAARRDLGAERIEAMGQWLRRSVKLATDNPESARPFVREHAQEMRDDVCDQHIALYVNSWSIDLGNEGRRAVELFLAESE